MTSFAQVPDFKTLSSQRLCCSLPMSMSKGRRKSFLMNDVSEVSRDWFNFFLIDLMFGNWLKFQGEEEEDSKDEDDDENPRRRAVRRWKSWHFNLVSTQFGIFPKNRGNWFGLYVQWQYGSKNQYSGMLHCTCPALWSLAIGKAPSGRRFLFSRGNRWNQMKTSIMSSRDLFDK